MKREDITALLPDITEEQLDKIMGLHGADVTNLKESLDTAQKVIVGAALLAKVRKPEEVQLRAWLLQFLKAEVTRQADVTRILPLINELEALPGQ